MNTLTRTSLTELTIAYVINKGHRDSFLRFLGNDPSIPSWLNKLSSHRFAGPIHNNKDPNINVLILRYKGKDKVLISLKDDAWSPSFATKTKNLLDALISSGLLKSPPSIARLSLSFEIPENSTENDLSVRFGGKIFAHDNLTFKTFKLKHSSVTCTINPSDGNKGVGISLDISARYNATHSTKVASMLSDIDKFSISSIKGIDRIFPIKIRDKASTNGYRLACKKSVKYNTILKNILRNERQFHFPTTLYHQIRQEVVQASRRLDFPLEV